ncbi:MAG TPA: DEAD/DEAH box helicase, partial [Polyangiaceae bacterium]
MRAWFEERFPHGPTSAQARGWPLIRQGHDTLIAAPTGSGKTLAAFLMCIDELYRQAQRRPPDQARIEIVYVSPLKALVTDIGENLARPLDEIRSVAERLGLAVPEIRVGMRTGDTPASERAKLLKAPPHILVTTPESLYLLTTARKSRDSLRNVRAVIIDEIHATARDKRGVHLALTLERLSALTERRPQRIGLSATQRPIETIARLLVGSDRSDAAGRPLCALVDEGHRRALDLALELPDRELEAVASTEQLGETTDRIAALVEQHKTTLVFVNTRRLSERLAHMLAERLGDERVAAHHGSLSKDRRHMVETRLRQGQLSVLVATASLELGIDIGPVELVCQVGSPRSIATFLQRVGRSGHTRFGTPKGRLFPSTRDELVECAALLRAVHAGQLDASAFPEAPLDILAQQIVAECAAEPTGVTELYELCRRAAPYANLTRESFERVVDLVSDGVVTGRGRRAAYVHRDRVHERLRGRRQARLVALTSGGAIPEMADYRVVADPGEIFVGTINEDFAIESIAGDVFLLGSTSWRIRRVERGVVRVVDAQGAMPTIPFWLGEAPARTAELSREVSRLRSEVSEALVRRGVEAACSWVEESCSLGSEAARALVEYLASAQQSLGLLPTQERLVVERFFDETGGMQLVVHSPYGARVNRGLGLLLRKRFCRSFDFELQAAANDDAIVLSLGPQHGFALDDLAEFLSPKGIEQALVHAVLPTPMFQARWRWNLNRSLLVLRYKGGRKNPPPIQRMESDDIMASVFPSLAACQDNASGPREIPDHPIVNQTLHDCMTEAMDLAALTRLLAAIAEGSVTLALRDTTEPSLLSHEIINGRPYTFLDDAPLEERRTRAVQLRRGVPLDARDLSALDVDAIDRVLREARPEPRDAEELHDLLCELHLAPPMVAHTSQFAALCETGRARTLELGGTSFWCATERLAAVGALLPETAAVECGASDLDPELLAQNVVRAHLEVSGPVVVADLCVRTGLSESVLAVALAALEREGSVFRGHFDSRIGAQQFCSRRLLARIHGYTQKRLRREIEPVSPRDFMRFLLEHQHVTAATRRRGQHGVLLALEQLQGFEAAAPAWEAELLPARIEHYEPAWLDAHCWSGEVVWGRLLARAAAESGDPANVSLATPITLALREDFAWLRSAARGSEREPGAAAPSEGRAEAALAVLRRRGASFFAELSREADLSDAQLEAALWDGVARGLLTADGFAALRALFSTRLAPAAARAGRRRLRRGLSVGTRPNAGLGAGPHASAGRWAILAPPEAGADRDELAEAMAEQLLARYG